MAKFLCLNFGKKFGKNFLCLNFGKKFFAASSVKKMSRFEEVSPEEIKIIVDNATPISTKRSTKYGLKIFIGRCVLTAIKYL